MIVCPNEKIVFMNIPKTGTRSVLQFLQANMQEVKSRGHQTDPPKQFLTDEYFRFTTIRNPYDRACSHYWAMCRRGNDRYGYLRAMNQMKLDNSLKSYLIITMDDITSRQSGGRQKKTGHPFNPQMAYIEGKNVHQFIHLENIDEEFKTLPFIDGKVTLPHANTTTEKSTKNPNYIPRPPWQELVGKEEAEMINEMCKVDFDAFSEYEKI